MSYSLFCKLRPFHIVHATVRDCETCLFTVHENMQLMRLKLRQLQLLPSYYNTVEKCVKFWLSNRSVNSRTGHGPVNVASRTLLWLLRPTFRHQSTILLRDMLRRWPRPCHQSLLWQRRPTQDTGSGCFGIRFNVDPPERHRTDTRGHIAQLVRVHDRCPDIIVHHRIVTNRIESLYHGTNIIISCTHRVVSEDPRQEEAGEHPILS